MRQPDHVIHPDYQYEFSEYHPNPNPAVAAEEKFHANPPNQPNPTKDPASIQYFVIFLESLRQRAMSHLAPSLAPPSQSSPLTHQTSIQRYNSTPGGLLVEPVQAMLHSGRRCPQSIGVLQQCLSVFDQARKSHSPESSFLLYPAHLSSAPAHPKPLPDFRNPAAIR